MDGWVNAVVSDEDWNSEVLTEEYRNIAALLVRKSDLVSHFSDDGALLSPVEFWASGDAAACIAVFQANALDAVMWDQHAGWRRFAL